MSDLRIPVEVAPLIHGPVATVGHLDLLLALRRAAPETRAVGSLAVETRLDAHLVARRCLDELSDAGLLERDAGAYRYAPADPATRAAVDVLAALTARRYRAVVRALYRRTGRVGGKRLDPPPPDASTFTARPTALTASRVETLHAARAARSDARTLTVDPSSEERPSMQHSSSSTRRGRGGTTRVAGLALSVVAGLLAVHAAGAQGGGSSPCRPLCAPSVTLMPGALRSHLFGGPTVRAVAGGGAHRLPGSTNFEAIAAVASRTAIPRVSLFGSVQWLPNATEARNPFTLYTANELGSPVHANAPTMTVGLSGAVVSRTALHGWADLAVNAGDLFSQAARPGDRRAYTHKLDLGLLAHVYPLGRAAAGTYLHRVALYGILDYVATGLPKAGDQVPAGRVFVTDARPAALIVGLALPITGAEP